MVQPSTLGEALLRAYKTWPEKTAYIYPKGKEYATVSYKQLGEQAKSYASALKNLGIQRGDMICIQSENCVEWAFVDWACQSLGIILIPIYPTLPADQTQFIIQDAQAKLVISSTPEQLAKLNGLNIQSIQLEKLTELAQTTTLDEAEWIEELQKSNPEDLATIIYTSGTTGNPKGAMIPQRAPIHVCRMANQEIELNHTDTFFTYLPMSHVFERVVGQWLPIYLGATIGFAKNLATISADLQAIKPTLLCCVPRFLEAMMDRMVSAANKQGGISAKLFNMALNAGQAKLDGKPALLSPLLDKVVGAKIRARLGGRIRLMVSGGAALPAHLARFYKAFGFEIIQGYGLTETAGGSFVNRPGKRNKYWTVGETLGMDTKIAEDGEILMKGPGLFTGYFNRPEETAEVMTSDGYFRTGDIGEFEGSYLKITDRKKDLLVLGNGKNVAPQKIENLLKEDILITEAVLFGDGNDFLVALILPNFEKLRENPEFANIPEQELVEKAEVKTLIQEIVDKVNKKVADYERVKRHTLIWQQFSVDNGELTPTFKVKRKAVFEKYQNLIRELMR
jgi:long-chain acyl-CoA synthetase